MRNIEIMFHDGIIGQKSVLLALSALTTGNLNSKLREGAKSYKMQDILPMAHDYIIPPLSDEEKAQQSQQNIINFMMNNAPKGYFNA